MVSRESATGLSQRGLREEPHHASPPAVGERERSLGPLVAEEDGDRLEPEAERLPNTTLHGRLSAFHHFSLSARGKPQA